MRRSDAVRHVTPRRPPPLARAARAAAVVALVGAGIAASSAGFAATQETPMLDPWVPPTLRKAAPPHAAAGDALRAQVERELRAAFDAADVERAGALTREQARAAGLGYIVKNFDAMDAAGRGRVSFDDVKRYLRARGANL